MPFLINLPKTASRVGARGGIVFLVWCLVSGVWYCFSKITDGEPTLVSVWFLYWFSGLPPSAPFSRAVDLLRSIFSNSFSARLCTKPFSFSTQNSLKTESIMRRSEAFSARKSL